MTNNNNYVKKYEVGNIRLDAPYTHFIYELPLLSFGDVLHTVNLALVFQSKLTDNPFHIANGYKLNLQKRIVIENGIPRSYEEGNGTLVVLNKFGDKYTFSDDSQRIIRKIDQLYVLENPDYSTEVFDNNGNITLITDKYGRNLFEYEYSGNKLTYIGYRVNDTNKGIELSYNSTGLQRISYVCEGDSICTTAFTNISNGIKLEHYSGVDYYTTFSASKFCAYSTDHGVSTPNSQSFYQSLECTVTDNGTVDKTLYVESKRGNIVVNNTVYYFPEPNGQKISIVDVTDYHGVKVRTQYINDKPLYSYEYDSSKFPTEKNTEEETDEQMLGFSFESDISIYNNNNEITGCQKFNSGTRMNYDSSGNYWHYDLTNASGESSEKYVIISGWLKKLRSTTISGETPACIITVYDETFENNPSFMVGNLPLGEWVYFAIQATIDVEDGYIESPIISTNLNKKQLLMADFKITPQSEIEAYNVGKNYLTRVEDVAILETSNGADSIFFPLNLSYAFYNGENVINDNITSKDILKYKINQKYGTHMNEIYCNDCRKVIAKEGVFSIGYYSVEENKFVNVDVESLAVGKRYTYNDRTFVSKTNFYESESGIVDLITKYSKNGNYFKHIFYDSNLDITVTVDDDIITQYNRNDYGLITSQTISDKLSDLSVSSSVSYDSSCTQLLTSTNEVGAVTRYVTDTIWGIIVQSSVLDENGDDVMLVTDSFDDDFSVQTNRSFTKETLQRDHTFSYSNGNLSGITDGYWGYDFTYSNGGDLYQVKHNGVVLETHQITNNRQTYTTNYNTHSIVENYDKYGRLTSVGGRISNTYDLNPTANGNNFLVTSKNNGSAKLASTKDLVNNQTTKYAYDKDKVVKAATFNSSNVMVDERTLKYDDANRVTQDKFIYDITNSKYINESCVYDTVDEDPFADGRKYKTYYKLNENTKVDTTNVYDGLKRLITKTQNVANNSLEKEYNYNATRPSNIVYTKDNAKIHDFVYGYTKSGKLFYENDYSPNYNNLTYYYDSFGQLIREDNRLLDKTIKYSYNNGNIVSAEHYAYTSGETSGDATKTDAYVYDATNTKLVSFNGEAFTYNTRGYLLTHNKNGTSLQYGWIDGRLATISSNNNITDSYFYDGYGRRTKKIHYTLAGNQTVTNYYYDHNGRLLRETWGTKEIFYLYDESDIVGMIYTSGGYSKEYLFVKNPRGDVIGIYDTNGNVAAKYTYDAWGNYKIIDATNAEIATTNRILYRSYYYDHETKLYYLNARYYNPEWRRFISPDDTAYLDPESPNGLNLYAYCNNDPVNYADPSGHFVDIIFDTIFLLFGIVDLLENPSWVNVGMVALDAFLTVAPFIPAVSGLRHLGKIDDAVDLTKAYGHIDNFADAGGVIRRADELDFIDNGWELVQGLNKTSDGFTVSNRFVGIDIHTKFKYGSRVIDVHNRVDGIDDTLRLIYELKPYNKRSIKQGIKQLHRYKKAVYKKYGVIYEMILVVY